MSANENPLKEQLEGLLNKPCWFKEGTLEIRQNSDAFLSEVNEDHIVIYNSIFEKQRRILFSEIVSIERKDLVKKENLPVSAPNSSSSKSGCFIATAVYGSPYANEVMILKAFRDEWLLNYSFGKAFVKLYYWISPPIANQIAKQKLLKELTKSILIIPLIKIANILKRKEN